MDVRYINPFLLAVKNVFDTMLNMPFNLGKPMLKPDKRPLYDVSSMIGLSGNVTGCVVINMSGALAMALVGALTGEKVNSIDDDCMDAIGEISNMITGNAKKDFPCSDTSISIPSVVVGKHKTLYPNDIPIISIPCETSFGRLMVDIAIKHGNTASNKLKAQAAMA
ncbi:MAG: chemotaxis protein CheX [Phycisphaerae bacterium]|nr:chemotaxis protein CheX [Phycisphaerae bacterium]